MPLQKQHTLTQNVKYLKTLDKTTLSYTCKFKICKTESLVHGIA